MKRLSIILPLVLLIFGISLLLNTYVSAQDAGQGLEISPPSQDVSVDPGETKTITAKIRNRGNSTLPIEVHIEDFTAKGEEGQVELNANSPYSVASWTKVSPTTFKLGPGEEQEVIATVKVPENAAGGRFGSFVFAVKPEKGEGNAAAISQQIASLFLLKVNGPLKEALNIKEFIAPEFAEFGPVPLTIKLENKGNVHVKAYGLINITDMFGNKVADVVVPATNVFPEATRAVTAPLNQQFLIGKYTATAIMYYGSTKNQTLLATNTFYVFPTKIVGGIFFVLLVLYLLRKRFKKAGKAMFGK